MAFGLYSLLEAVLLTLNAICILHEQRFLAKGSTTVVEISSVSQGSSSSVWFEVSLAAIKIFTTNKLYLCRGRGVRYSGEVSSKC